MLIKPTGYQLAYVLFRHIRLITYITLLFFLLALAYALIAVPRYVSQTSFVAGFSTLPSAVPSNTPQTTVMPTPVDHAEIINSYILELQSSDLLRQVVTQIGPENLYPPRFSFNPLAWLPSLTEVSDDPATKREEAVEDAVDRLTRRDMVVVGERDANVFSLTILNPNRQLAIQFSRLLSDKFLQLVGHIDRNPRLAFVQGQLDIFRQKVSEAQAAMEAFKKDSQISSMAEERTVLIQQRGLLDQAMMGSESKSVESQMRYTSIGEQLPKISPTITTPQNDRDPIELTARTNLSSLNVRLSQMLAAYSANSPAVLEAERSVAAGREILRRATQSRAITHTDPNVSYQQLQIAMVQAKGDWSAASASAALQRKQLSDLNDRLSRMDGIEGTYQDLVREYQNADQNYRAYLQGVQQARVDDDLNKANVTSVAIFNPPFASPKPTRPGILVLSLGLFGGLIFGCMLAFIREAMDETLNKPDQVRDVLGLPVLGTIRLR